MTTDLLLYVLSLPVIQEMKWQFLFWWSYHARPIRIIPTYTHKDQMYLPVIPVLDSLLIAFPLVNHNFLALINEHIQLSDVHSLLLFFITHVLFNSVLLRNLEENKSMKVGLLRCIVQYVSLRREHIILNNQYMIIHFNPEKMIKVSDLSGKHSTPLPLNRIPLFLSRHISGYTIFLNPWRDGVVVVYQFPIKQNKNKGTRREVSLSRVYVSCLGRSGNPNLVG